MKTNAHIDLKLTHSSEYMTVAEFLTEGDAITAAVAWQLGPQVERIRVMVLYHRLHAKSRTYWLCDYAKDNTEQIAEEAAPVQ